jgi:hypothetical protein
MTTISYLAFEVVYQPQEIRVYVYGPSQQSQSARDVQGEVGLRRRNSDRTFTGTLQYVAPPPGTSEQDYLAVRANLSGVNDGDMMSTVKLANLPFRNRSEVTFTQSVVGSNAKPQVTLAALDPSDQAGIVRQRVCPVTGAALDSMGGPIKALVGSQPLYLCCNGCLGKVRSDPEAHLRKASQVP